MVRFASSLIAGTFAICSVSAADPTWSSQFKSKIDVLPKATGDCSVCFYEGANYTGTKFCIGKREKGCTKANPITAPGTIGSIKFSKRCALVANVRVTDVPYNEHVDVISKDAPNTGYNVTSGEQSVQELYVEEAGHACFLGIPTTGEGYGVCYNKDVPAVDKNYENSITELLLFKSAAKDFDVIVYENENYNNPQTSVVQKDISEGDTGATSYRFTDYSKDLTTELTTGISGLQHTLQNKVRSARFVAPENDPTQDAATPGSVAPLST
ncbi:hypothetical protein PHMEG_000247 [Phytophthora megakarya]|uniref:Uncharacterized protein n=1 Tax=Phytophthora megakarya TaxID=4795 RepID=A0A225X5Y1_9STRA|nr:hypothetical protein PHMEG_000247 [Phytophthora megakarya]